MTRLALFLIAGIVGALLVVALALVAEAVDSREARAEARAFDWHNSYVNAEARLKLAQAKPDRAAADEAVLLGPVSAWVAEGEARAVREWERT